MNLTTKIAWRYLKAKKTHNAVNIISIISVCGVVIATTALVCVLSVFNGFAGLMSDKLAKLDPQVKIQPVIGKTLNADSIINVLRSVEDIELSQPVVEEQALAIYSDKQMPVNIKGISHDYNKLTQFDDVIRFGEFELGDSTDKYAIISILVASNLQSGTGFYDNLRIYTPKRQGVINIANPAGAFRQDSLHISAIYQTDQNTYDRDMVFLPIEVAKRLLSYDNNTATAVELKLRKNADETAVINRISSMLGNDYTVNDRLMQQASAYKMVNVEKWVTFLLLSFILIIASFNVISSLSLLIIEKDESITTFHNLGATNRQITQIFVTEGLLISFIGALAGILLGVIICLLQQEFGLIKLAGDKAAVIIDSYPVQLIFSDLIIVFAMVAVVGLFTSVITALFMRARLNK